MISNNCLISLDSSAHFFAAKFDTTLKFFAVALPCSLAMIACKFLLYKTKLFCGLGILLQDFLRLAVLGVISVLSGMAMCCSILFKVIVSILVVIICSTISDSVTSFGSLFCCSFGSFVSSIFLDPLLNFGDGYGDNFLSNLVSNQYN